MTTSNQLAIITTYTQQWKANFVPTQQRICRKTNWDPVSIPFLIAFSGNITLCSVKTASQNFSSLFAYYFVEQVNNKGEMLKILTIQFFISFMCLIINSFYFDIQVNRFNVNNTHTYNFSLYHKKFINIKKCC
jgi:hypothetical protein